MSEERQYSLEPIFYTYQLRLENSDLPFYVGKGVGYRARTHFYKASLKSKSHKNNTILKAQMDKIKVLIEYIEKDITEEEAFGLEITCIALYGRSDKGLGPLTNKTDGGDGFKNIIPQYRKCEVCGGEFLPIHYNMFHGSKCGIKQKKLPYKKQEIVVCEVCGESIQLGVYTRLHGSKCGVKLGKRSEETVQKMQEAASKRTKIYCEYCQEYRDPAAYHRSHGEKCKYKDKNYKPKEKIPEGDKLKCPHCERELSRKGYYPHVNRCSINPCAKSITKKECEHCGIIVSKGMYSRWHGDKCKMKP